MEPNTPFVSARGWSGAHRQTLRAKLRANRTAARLAGQGHYVTVPLDQHDAAGFYYHSAVKPGPVVVLLPGLGGDAGAEYILATAQRCLEAGYPVARVDFRGTGQAAHRSASVHHTCRSDDLLAICAAITAQGNAPLVAVGFSMGGNVLLHTLRASAHDIQAAMTVCSPLDVHALAVTAAKSPGGIYERYMHRNLQQQALAIARQSSGNIDAIKGARNLDALHDVLAQLAGYENGHSYYDDARITTAKLIDITTPVTMLHSCDDPMVSVETYEAINWASLPRTTLKLTRQGGHVGYHLRGGGRQFVLGTLELADSTALRLGGLPPTH